MAKTPLYWDGDSYNEGGGSRATRFMSVTTPMDHLSISPSNTCVQITSQGPATGPGVWGKK